MAAAAELRMEAAVAHLTAVAAEPPTLAVALLTLAAALPAFTAVARQRLTSARRLLAAASMGRPEVRTRAPGPPTPIRRLVPAVIEAAATMAPTSPSRLA